MFSLPSRTDTMTHFFICFLIIFFIFLVIINEKDRTSPILNSSQSVAIIQSRLGVFGDWEKRGTQRGDVKGVLDGAKGSLFESTLHSAPRWVRPLTSAL